MRSGMQSGMRCQMLSSWWRHLYSVFLVFFVLILTGCGREPLTTRESFVFGTRVEVLIYGVTDGRAQAAAADVLREFDRFHRSYHAWQPSELTALNTALAAGNSHEVSAELAALIGTAQQISARSKHLFDPGIGHLIRLWGFQSDEFKARLPRPAQLAAWRRSHPSIADLQLDGRRVSSRNPAVALDFGGYLKGVALDRAAVVLRSHGIRNALVNIGGNILVLGRRGDTPWRVGIQHPRSTAPLLTLELRDGEAIGTSGDYQRYFEVDGQRYCHLLDPRTAAPVRDTQAVTVLIPPGADAGMRSDVLSKPIFIAGSGWRDMARQMGVEQALRVAADGTVFVTPALRERLKPSPDETKMIVVP